LVGEIGSQGSDAKWFAEAKRPASSRIAATRSPLRSPKRPSSRAAERPATWFNVKAISSTGALYI